MTITEPQLAIPNARVRMWDGAWQLRYDMGGLTAFLTESGISFTIPGDSDAARFLVNEDHPVVHVTIDDNGQRRWGVVNSWTLHKTGPCAKCEHCTQPALTVSVHEWRPV